MRNDFTKLKLKMLFQILLVILGTAAAGVFIQYVFIDGIFQDSFAEGFIALCRTMLHISRDDAILLYSELFRQHKEFWIVVGFLVLLGLAFYLSLSRFTRYFTEIIGGVDQLEKDSTEPIHLSRDLDFMEKKLNAVNNTLQKRAKDAREAEQRKNDLVVYLAHDIKTPLTSVIGYLNLLCEAPDMPQEQRAKYMGITLEKAYRLEQLINEFFEITRFNLQTIILNKDKINLSYMLMQIADEFYPTLAVQEKTVKVTAPPDFFIFGDADKLARVFNNILKNAAAYSEKNSVIRIDARIAPASLANSAASLSGSATPISGSAASGENGQNGEVARIAITNSGRTIPRQQLERIFEKFYRIDSARPTGTGGSGLGLAIAREIVSAHGGCIYAESENGFTRFVVELPISPNEFYPPSHPASAADD